MCYVHYFCCHNRSAGQYDHLCFTNEKMGGWSFNDLSNVTGLTSALSLADRTVAQ